MGEMPDLSSIFELLSSTHDSNQAPEASCNTQSSTNSNFEMPDMETMMKIMKVMNSMNSSENNAGTNLLNSLKPFLRDSKKEKIDQYIRFLKISNAISHLSDLGGDQK